MAPSFADNYDNRLIHVPVCFALSEAWEEAPWEYPDVWAVTRHQISQPVPASAASHQIHRLWHGTGQQKQQKVSHRVANIAKSKF